MGGATDRGGARGRRLPRSARVGGGREIRALLRRGRRYRTRHLDVFESASPAPRSRIGFVVARYKNGAVARNRLKRRLKEIARIEVLPRLRDAGIGVDVLVRARRAAYVAGYEELRAELEAWVEKRCSRG